MAAAAHAENQNKIHRWHEKRCDSLAFLAVAAFCLCARSLPYFDSVLLVVVARGFLFAYFVGFGVFVPAMAAMIRTRLTSGSHERIFLRMHFI